MWWRLNEGGRGSDVGTEGSVLWRRNPAEERKEKGVSEEAKETPCQQAAWS